MRRALIAGQIAGAVGLFVSASVAALSFHYLGVDNWREATATARAAVFGEPRSLYLKCGFEGARFAAPEPSLRTNRSRCIPSPLAVDRNLELIADFRPDSPIRELARSVVRIDLLYCGKDKLTCDKTKGKVLTCTGVLVDAVTVLTALHCFPVEFLKAGGGFKAQLWFGYVEDFEPEDEVMPGEIKRFGLLTEPVILDHGARDYLSGASAEAPVLDYALLRLASADADRIAAAGFAPAKFTKAPPEGGADLLVIHHPLGDVLHVSRRNCRFKVDLDLENSGALVGHSCGTLPGTSGAPIFDERTRSVIAIHVRGDPQVVRLDSADGFGLRMTTIAADLKPENADIRRALLNEPTSTSAADL